MIRAEENKLKDRDQNLERFKKATDKVDAKLQIKLEREEKEYLETFAKTAGNQEKRDKKKKETEQNFRLHLEALKE